MKLFFSFQIKLNYTENLRKAEAQGVDVNECMKYLKIINGLENRLLQVLDLCLGDKNEEIKELRSFLNHYLKIIKNRMEYIQIKVYKCLYDTSTSIGKIKAKYCLSTVSKKKNFF